MSAIDRILAARAVASRKNDVHDPDPYGTAVVGARSKLNEAIDAIYTRLERFDENDMFLYSIPGGETRVTQKFLVDTLLEFPPRLEDAAYKTSDATVVWAALWKLIEEMRPIAGAQPETSAAQVRDKEVTPA